MRPVRAGRLSDIGSSSGSRVGRSLLAVRCQAGPQQRPLNRPRIPPPPPPPAGYSRDPGPQYNYSEPQQGGSWPVTEPEGSATPGGNNQGASEGNQLNSYAKAIVAAAFVVGISVGVFFDSEVVLTPANVSSTEIIDRLTPSADICLANGYGASVLSMNVFVTYNPFNVYISQPQVKGGCVLRRANVGLLEREKLVTPHEVDLCKQRMNTFAYVGDLKTEPQVECVYHSEEAENQYLQVLSGNRAKMTQLLMQPSPPAPEAAAATAAAASQ